MELGGEVKLAGVEARLCALCVRMECECGYGLAWDSAGW